MPYHKVQSIILILHACQSYGTLSQNLLREFILFGCLELFFEVQLSERVGVHAQVEDQFDDVLGVLGRVFFEGCHDVVQDETLLFFYLGVAQHQVDHLEVLVFDRKVDDVAMPFALHVDVQFRAQLFQQVASQLSVFVLKS